jgi:glycosyltransferase involved in cell wall biosynthesis
MQASLVSIIIPCFNAAGCIQEAIESALAQTYCNKEIIVVDDGSSDNSLPLIEAFGHRVRCVTGPNEGAAAARNKGLAIASGEFVQFLDADDWLDPRKLEEQVPVLLNNLEIDVVYSDWVVIGRHSPSPQTCGVLDNSRDPVVLNLQRQNIQTGATLYRRQVLNATGGFRSDLPCCQERELNLRLACNDASFRRVPGRFHVKRQFPRSLASNELRVIKWMRPILWETYEALKRDQRLSRDRSEAFASLMAWQGRRLILHGNEGRAMEYFADASEMDPSGGLEGAYGRVGTNLVRVFGFSPVEKILLRFGKVKSQMRSVLLALGMRRRSLSGLVPRENTKVIGA